VTLICCAIAGWSVAADVTKAQAPAAAAAQPLVKAYAGAYVTARNVPVLVYHEMNNSCAASAPVCNSGDPESVSTAQFTAEMASMVKAGYHTVSMAQYTAWLANGQTKLPVKPFLIIADNGIFSFLDGAQEILARDGYTATAAIVTGFADGASGQCAPKINGINVQPGCPSTNKYWDATWAQLAGLDPHVWSFILEAGPSGHYVQDYDARCRMFDTCKLPGESNVAYQARVSTELASGLTALKAHLPASQVDTHAWVAPYSDLGYPRCRLADCTPQDSTGPAGWLPAYAASLFSAVFVEDASRNAIDNERFRYNVSSHDTEKYFEATLAAFISAGDFSRR
jgi:hypothetical protein